MTKMPAGKYWVGDLCYVMHDVWEEFCEKAFPASDPAGIQGEMVMDDGRKVWFHSTAWGDGSFRDQAYKEYLVDAGLIGCILVDDVKIGVDSNDFGGGHIVEFPKDFECTYHKDGGEICFGTLIIVTDPQEDYDDEDEYDD